MEHYQTINPTTPRSLKLAICSWVLPLMGLLSLPIYFLMAGYSILGEVQTIFPIFFVCLYVGLTLAGPIFTVGAWIQCKRLGRQFLSHAVAGTIINVLSLLLFGYLAFLIMCFELYY